MGEFATLRSYGDFEHSVRLKRRFVHETAVNEFLSVVLETSRSRLRKISAGMTFYRAQRGFALRDEVVSDDEVIEVETAHPPERMRPAAEFVRDGRANPRGIPYLYLAGSPKTAMSEVRPWIESRVTLAAFKTVRDCLVVDCSLDKTPSYMLELDLLFTNGGKSIVPPDAQTKEAAVWGDIAYAFSKPVEPDDSALDYLPTQILAEAFRADGYDGIIYKSLLNRVERISFFSILMRLKSQGTRFSGRNQSTLVLSRLTALSICLQPTQKPPRTRFPKKNPNRFSSIKGWRQSWQRGSKFL